MKTSTLPAKYYPTSSQTRSNDARNYTSATNYSRGYSSQTNNTSNSIPRQSNFPPMRTYSSTSYNRPRNNVNDTRNITNTSTHQVDSSGTYPASNSQPFTTSTQLNQSSCNRTQNTSGFNNMSTIQNQTTLNQLPIGDTCKWCSDHRRRHNHDTKDCHAFTNATSNEKWNAVDRHGLCMWCLQPKHLVKNCPNGLNEASRCNFCALSHNRNLGCRPSSNANPRH